ncbi:cytochrome P450 [Xylariaceae sp. AK1471]|nr:cytochrome P450 [Xylariaceae sp. AK1471]
MFITSLSSGLFLPYDLGLLTCLSLCCIITVAVYRLYFHPLSKFPGPFWAHISAFPAYYHTLKKDRHVWLWCLQEKYGPNFRIAPNSVLINTPTGLKAIYTNNANVEKAEYYKVYPRHVGAVTTWNCIDKTVHARKRRVLNNAFSDKALRSAEPFIHENIDRWCELLEQKIGGRQWSKSLNMADWANYLVFDILGDLCFGKCFDMKEPSSNLRGVPGLMVSFLELMHPIAFSPFAGVFTWLKPRGLDRILAAAIPRSVKDWENFVQECFEDRVKVEEELQHIPKPESSVRKDFFHYLFQAADQETGVARYSRDELLGESESLIIAGSDTTAIGIAAAMFYLVHNPDVQATLVKEIYSAFSSFDEIRGNSKLHRCKYLRAFIHEVLRMSPPVAADLSREVSEGGIVVDDQFIPQGVRVSTAAYCLHHNENFFPEPFKFRPERWIVDENDKTGSSAGRVALAESCFCAFSIGPRGCVGKNLAYLEMCITIAKTLYRFEVRRDLSSNIGGGSQDAREGRRVADQYQLYDIFVAARDGPMVHFKRRSYT